MGAVICTSGKTASREHSSGRQSGKSLRRKITKDSIYDSSDYVECSSLIRTNGKERLQFTSKHEIHANIPTQLEPKEYKIKPCGIANCNCSLCQKIDNSSKCAPTQRLFKNVWGRKHKTYSSDSTLSATKNSSDIPSTKEDCDSEPPNQPQAAYKESVVQTNEVTVVKDNSTSTTACLDHLTTHLSLNEKCGLCDFVESGKHDRWNSLEEDANLFREVSKNITKWLRTTPKCMKRIVLHSVEPEQKIRITLWKDKAGVQEILVTDGDQPCQIKVANPPENVEPTEDVEADDEEEEEEAEAGASGGEPAPPQNDAEEPVAEENLEASEETVENGGEAVVVRRMNPRGGQLLRSKAQESDSLDQAENRLPPVDTMEACNKAAERLRELAHHLQHGEVPVNVLQKALQYAACVLDTVCVDDSSRRTIDDDDELSEFHPNAVPTEVREWLASTFSKKTATQRKRSEDKPRFRSVANAIRAGIMVDRLYRRMSNSTLFYIPTHISIYLKGLDDYSFDVFSLNEKANGQGLRYLAYDLLNRYGLTHKFKIASSTMENFMSQILHGYVRHKNPYHNDLHAADVTQTVHYMLCQQGLANWLSDLEIFAALIAAIVHDFEHTGTTNNFHVMSRSETALLYNDRAVLENHHVSTAFRLMRDDDCNILSHLSKEEYKEFRTLVIDMVLATDMSSHFQQIKSIKSLIGHPDFTLDKSKALSLVLHCCDISHPSKIWDLHHRWTLLLMEEFFLQGDKEHELGLPYSPLCDRNTTLIAESQIGFIEFIVSPSLEVFGDMLEKIEQKNQNIRSPPISETLNEEPPPADSRGSSPSRKKSQTLAGALISAVKRDSSPEAAAAAAATSSPNPPDTANCSPNLSPSTSAPTSPKITAQSKSKVKRPWIFHLEENKTKWKERTHRDAELRAQLSVAHDNNGDDVGRVIV
ncbi:dual specificity calcium/calmodulin-dependent 3',5'-cyclic nucleotide phosphodiesterase 1A-like isoform X3 [Argiope bruennichi]|uniref:dual specificity calcium/calmodulin-dependent 3',5'-cyclic nucleotide phosphodiesterase 1A-like isoform X3 n=1 Tax=Argiope bruennichi TaxID=94029 RepID=UPI0024944709|nr:dual specificity calcium/calmodulin-dependent 3',5'-cyclic nucleotide phosphodiesterase 1A-like isoform X3 [Argiope bruennichi]